MSRLYGLTKPGVQGEGSRFGGYPGFYIRKWQHSSLDGRTPVQVYFGGLTLVPAASISPPLRSAPNGNRWRGPVGNPSIGTEKPVQTKPATFHLVIARRLRDTK